MLPTLLPILIQLVVRQLGKITATDVDRIVQWIKAQHELHPEKQGWEKADTLVQRFTEFFGRRDGHVARTVIQLAYSLAKLKGVIP